MRPRTRWLILGAFLVSGFAYYVASRPMDFRVYYEGARGVFEGIRPVYGHTSGIGWPMHYRYPPLFLLLFTPFTWLPLKVAAGVWLVLKAAVLFLLLRAMRLRLSFSGKVVEWVVPVLLAGPYLIQDFRYGNVQFFIFALAAAGLLEARSRPVLSGASFALGISLKVWPLFFLPYLAARRDWKVVGWTLIFTMVLSVLPSFYFGFAGNLALLGRWFAQEFTTQLGKNEIWFPSQSLRGVLERYFTRMDYSKVPDSDYPLIHIATLDPTVVWMVWFLLAAAAYTGLVVIAYRSSQASGWVEHGLAFCLIGLLEPFTQKYALVILLWPAMIAGLLTIHPVLRKVVYVAVALVVIQTLVPGSAEQRLLQVLGMDFLATAVLAAAMAMTIFNLSCKLAAGGLCK